MVVLLRVYEREGQSALDWWTRKRIALGSARGLAYLHDDCIPGIIHRKIKAANIFLNEDRCLCIRCDASGANHWTEAF